MGNMNLNSDAIELFWQWFVKNEKLIKDCIENEHSTHKELVVDQMNEHILGLGMLTWDLGLNEDNNWFLMLSPNGDKEMLNVSQRIISDAPEHMDWLFYASRPPKSWNRTFKVYNASFDEVHIDASEWHYLIFEDEDEKLVLVLEAQSISHLDDELADNVGEQFVIHELGELPWMFHISSVEIVSSVEIEHETMKNHVSDLSEHLAELIQK